MIRTRNLKKIYLIGQERVAALAGINLEIARGEVCCIIGQSGSGKSTLLNMLAGLEPPTTGVVAIAGQKITSMSENQLAIFRQENLGFIFQSYNLLPQLTATENVALPLMFAGVDKKQRLEIARRELKRMGMGHRLDHLPREMSGGQQQRVGIARAFVAHPKVIFADEPTGNLDTVTTRQVLRRMLDHSARHKITFVMVTHEPELAQCGDRIVALRDGKVVKNTVQDEKTKRENRGLLCGETDDD
ncbi:MAG: ABC transporter ATP-binding protein [Coriobacteriales bacterium]|jgi:putative ABC transport system ATP-binding protein|nr:ABC transporter ATP-binding protein [Coriobacteriales bacterium]